MTGASFSQLPTHIFGPSFVAKEKDTLKKQSLTLIEQTCMAFLFQSCKQLQNFITDNTVELDHRVCKILTEGYALGLANSMDNCFHTFKTSITQAGPSLMACFTTYDSYSSISTV